MVSQRIIPTWLKKYEAYHKGYLQVIPDYEWVIRMKFNIEKDKYLNTWIVWEVHKTTQ